MEYAEKLKSMLTKEVDEIAKKGELSSGALEALHKLTDTIKNIDKIEKLEGNEASYNDQSDTSNGRHYVRGHYSNHNVDTSKKVNPYSYSRNADYIMEQLANMLYSVNNDRDRRCIEDCIERLEGNYR